VKSPLKKALDSTANAEGKSVRNTTMDGEKAERSGTNVTTIKKTCVRSEEDITKRRR
jgi:hypothetical protein